MRRFLPLLATTLVPFNVTLAADTPANGVSLGDMVVTAPLMSETDPLTVVTDPKAARQPIPAPDGAAYLKNIPGFAVSRKGGTDGDPALRGMGGSRLNILLDDAYILGGCGHRMDPPTAYVYPESYDKIIVTKGPEDVLYGASVAGTVRFERDTKRFEQPGVRGIGSLVAGSFGRNDQMFDVTAGNPTGYLRAIGTRSDSNDYEDGNGDEVHSFYTRWSGTAVAGWTPDADTKLQFSYDRSDGEAAYADRTLDGKQFDRTGYGLKFEKNNLSPLLEKVEFKAYHNYIDHIMDNYSLRTPPMMKKVMNPDRKTSGARLAFQLGLGADTFANVGADYEQNEHTVRMAMAMGASYPVLGDRNDKASFKKTGIFGQLNHSLTRADRIVTGLRFDTAEAEAEQQKTMMDPDGYGGADPGDTTTDHNTSGFVRYEHDLASMPGMVYAGIGRAERSPDFWERDRDFNLDTEKNTQLDVGWGYKTNRVKASVSLFYADITDYIQLTNNGTAAENIDATTYGGEADLAYTFAQYWKVTGTLAYTHGENDTDNKPLAQMPPLEGTLALDYNNNTYSAGVLWRLVDEQDRVDVGSGTIYGTDIGETAGFNVLSVHAGYRPTKKVLLTAGVDNLLDRAYAEHLGTGSADAGAVTGLVNEPGRTLWVKVSANL
jgi:iron complex outermembrane receptor protein